MNRFLWLILCLFSLALQAQTEVLSLDQYEEKYGTFSPERRWGLLTQRNAYGQWKGAGRNKLAYYFEVFAREQGLRFPEYSNEKFVNLTFELKNDGTFGSVVYAIYSSERDPATDRIKMTFDEEYPPGLEEKLRTALYGFCREFRMNTVSLNKEHYSFAMALHPAERTCKPGFICTPQEALAVENPRTVKKVDFSGLKLTGIPPVLSRFENLEELILADNEFKSIPPEIWKFKNLKNLDLSKNQLTDRSFEMRRNTSMEVLNIQFNLITRLPSDIRKLKNLRELILGNNMLSDLENEKFKGLEQLKAINLYNAELRRCPPSISRLKNLEELDLYYNTLTLLPAEIGELTELKRLAVSNNKLWKLPDEIARLKKLEIVYAHHNKLTGLPKINSPLSLLDIGFNEFTKVPETVTAIKSLSELDISNCRLAAIPFELKELPALRKLFVSNNPMEKDKKLKADFQQFVVDLEQRSIQVK